MKGCVRVFSEYMEDYYRSKIGVKEICKLAGSSPTTFRRWMKKENLTPRQTYFKNINTGIISLDQVLKDRYSSIVNRCNGKTTDYYGKYKGLPYMTIYEWVEFCHDNKEKLPHLKLSFPFLKYFLLPGINLTLSPILNFSFTSISS